MYKLINNTPFPQTNFGWTDNKSRRMMHGGLDKNEAIL